MLTPKINENDEIIYCDKITLTSKKGGGLL